MQIKAQIHELFYKAFHKAAPEYDFFPHEVEITLSTNKKFGDYQCNSAMKFARSLGINPRDIADKIIANIEDNPIIKSLSVAGPGFINIELNPEYLANFCQTMLDKPNLAVAKHNPQQKIVVDFSCPNTAKEMHVGHLRSTIIGDSISRLFEFLGDEVLRLNHIGDWGTSFGMLIAYLKQTHPNLLKETDLDLSFLVKSYKLAKQEFDSSPDFKKQSQLEVVALQAHNQDSIKIWEKICDISRQAYEEIYKLLDVKLIERGESFYNPYLQKLIADLEEKDLIEVSDGAKCMFLPGFTNREGEPLPFMLQKSDGGFNYSTTDLAALRHRIEDEKANRIIYVTDNGQSNHFAMLFCAAQIARFLSPKKVTVNHVPFGLVLGPDGKKFKTRSGDTEKLIDLLTTAIDKAEQILIDRQSQNIQELNSNDLKELAKNLGISAVKYADLSSNRVNDYSFSYDRMLKFEGNTAAFLLYAFVRIKGIERKINEQGLTVSYAPIEFSHDSETSLGLQLAQFHDILEQYSKDLYPNKLADYLYQVAEKFNAFFRDCRVIGDPKQNQRLSLCNLTAKVLQTGLSILGIKTVEVM